VRGLRRLGGRLDHTYLIVHQHNGDKQDALVQR
jgi:hypothetical protein